MKKIEKRVNKAFTNATPNNFERVAQDCQRTPQQTAVRSRQGMFWKVSTCALAFILVVAVLFGGITLNTQYASAATITLDVNPSVELKINGNQRIVSATAQNKDGEIILAGMEDDLKGCSLKVAVNAIIGSMFRNGYLSELTNSVLVSVDSDKSLYEQLVQTVTTEIEVSLKGNAIDASVVSQWLTNDDAINALVAKYDISRGKAQLIHKIASQTDEEGNALYTEEQLVALSVNELGIILGNLGVDDVTQSGSSSEKAYIGSDKALEIALEKLGMEGLTAESEGLNVFKNKVDFDDGVMVYDIEFVYGGYEYEVEIGAISGEVLSFECALRDFKPGEGSTELTEEEIVAVALQNAGVADVTTEVSVCRYYRITVYTVSFQTEENYFEYDIDVYGNVLYSACIKLQKSEQDGYLTRKQAQEYFLEHNQQGFTSLDKLERFKICATTSEEGQLVYEISFVSENNKYVYTLNAVNPEEELSPKEISEYTDEINDIIKDNMPDWDDFEDIWNGWQGGWTWDDWFEGNGSWQPPQGEHIGGPAKPGDPQNNQLDEDQIKEIICKFLFAQADEVEWEEVELDSHQGMACYEIELKFNGVKYEFKVNAYTGSILKCDVQRNK
ncbi:MAG: PepSY domain-containing protein [Candidatus Fimimonas sp.]